MGGLFHSLNIGSQSLYASRQGIDTTAHNIANAQTEGYSRQRLHLTQREPVHSYGVLLGNGVFVGSIERMASKFLNKQVNLAKTDSGDSEARFEALSRLEAIYSPELGTNIADELNRFFSAWQNLAKYPEEVTVRTQVREQGRSLCEAFRQIDLDLRRQRAGLNEYIEMSTNEINQRLQTIAHLNTQIRVMETGVRNQSNDLRDQRDRLLTELSSLIDINYYEDKDGMLTIHGPGDTLLVDRSRAASFGVQQNGSNEGMFDIIVFDSENSASRNVTENFRGGRLGALIEIRDQVARTLLDQNNEMAYALMAEVNGIHSQGFGLKEFHGTSGRNFFEEVSDPEFAAQNMRIDTAVINSTDAISAASVMNAAGDNIVANRLASLQMEKVFADGQSTINEFYANYVGVLGMETLRVKQVNEADDIILADLSSRREALSGVSLDEEASNLIRWQTAFTASSKVITAVDEMFDTILSLKR